MIMALLCMLNIIMSYYDIDLPILSYIGGISILSIIFLYISSYTFKFCEYHRMFLHYIVVVNTINTIDMYYNIPIDDLAMLCVYMTITGIALFLILYMYVKSNKKSTIKNS